MKKLAIFAVLLLTFGCTSQKEPKGEVYSSAKLEMAALKNKYLQEIDRLLKKELSDDIKKNLKIIKDFIEGKSSDSYRAYEALKKIEEIQKRDKLKLFSSSQLKELKELIEMKARYGAPPVA